ncbi:MAG: HAD-IIB family hydrolase [Rhizobiaceae bacterium]|nr:HAD-IIB family hydrolase [Rhizobiaceae bacterium]
MNQVMIFDIDGTLTKSGQSVDKQFARFLMPYWSSRNCYVVSGSDRAKLRQQLPAELINLASGVFACSGNEFFSGSENHYSMSHSFPDELIEYCQRLVDQSPFFWRSGRHVEQRAGMLNISVAGRNSDRLERKRYVDFDKLAGERIFMADNIERVFPDYEVALGGQISIDITPKGWNKGRVYSEIRRLHPDSEIVFFGDRMEEGGNDLPLAEKLLENGHKVHAVKNFKETWDILQEHYPIIVPLAATA